MKGKPSSKAQRRRGDPKMRPEYDFSHGVRGKYASRLKPGSQIIVLDPDVAAAFGDSKAVNRALRTLLDVVPARSVRSSKRRTAQPAHAADKRFLVKLLGPPPADGGRRSVRLMHERADRLQLMRGALGAKETS